MGALIALLWEAFAQGEEEGTGSRRTLFCYMNIVRVRKPWRTAHSDACDIQLIKVHGLSLVPTDNSIFCDYCKLSTSIVHEMILQSSLSFEASYS